MSASVDGEDWGARRLARLFQDWGADATFFLNVHEARLWGEAPLARLSEDIAATGHEVALHTHPMWTDERRRRYLWQYTRSEQVALLERGMSLLEKWTGAAPVSHRAGAYAANEDTLSALEELGMRADSSLFYGHQNCRLNMNPGNYLRWRRQVAELPVTVFRQSRLLTTKLGMSWRRGCRLVKTDLDTCSQEQLQWFASESMRLEQGFMNLFMHSYSLLQVDRDFRHINKAPAQARKLAAFLEWAQKQKEIRILSVRSLLQEDACKATQKGGDDPAIPGYTETMSFSMALRRCMRRLTTQDAGLARSERP